MKKYFLLIILFFLVWEVNAQENINVSIEKFTKSGHTMIRVTIKNNNSFDIRIMNLASYSHQGEMYGKYPSSYMQLIANPVISFGNVNYIPDYYSQLVTKLEWDSFLVQYKPQVLASVEWESVASQYGSGLYSNGAVISGNGSSLTWSSNSVSSGLSSGNISSVSTSAGSTATSATSSTGASSSGIPVQNSLMINKYSDPILFDGTINPMGTNVMKHIDIKKGESYVTEFVIFGSYFPNPYAAFPETWKSKVKNIKLRLTLKYYDIVNKKDYKNEFMSNTLSL